MPRRPHRKGNDHTRSSQELEKISRKEIEFDESIDPWERQPTESARNHGLFLMYRDLGRIRTISQVAELTPLSYGALARIARFNKWVDRSGRWDAEQDRLTGLRLLSEREDMAKRHARAAQRLMEKALKRLSELDLDSISPHALVLMIDTAARIERAALGLETLNKGATSAQTVTVAASTGTDSAGKPEMRVEVGVMHERIMGGLDALVQRMSPEQITAGYQELTASAEATVEELNAALPAPPPQG